MQNAHLGHLDVNESPPSGGLKLEGTSPMRLDLPMLQYGQHKALLRCEVN